MAASPILNRVEAWFEKLGWKPFAFQKKTWRELRAGNSGLLHAPTGFGKTLALWIGFLLRHEALWKQAAFTRQTGLRCLWITPLRALAEDTRNSLEEASRSLGLGIEVGLRTGDTSAHQRKKQKSSPPFGLITTPESLTLLLSYPDFRITLGQLECVVVDEWHELLGSKRGTQMELALARLRTCTPRIPVWGLSATIGNLPEALAALTGNPSSSTEAAPVLIEGKMERKHEILTLLPGKLETFPWAGHMGLDMLEPVVEQIEKGGTTLVFTNTRSQTETWYGAILEARPEWRSTVGIHHGSVDPALRRAVETGLATGQLRAAVCTSSLDLGVDFSPVDQVIQIGSPKGVARLLQRAGRSGHQPGAVSRLFGVPTHTFELIEFSAARAAINAGEVESRSPVRGARDVLVQHLVTCALGQPFRSEELFREIRSTFAYRDLTEEDWNWLLDFVEKGGQALQAYPDYCRLVREDDRFTVRAETLARKHRLSIGTITSDSEVQLKTSGGRVLGSVEESFVSRLKPGSAFSFAGRRWSLVRLRGLVATVRSAGQSTGTIPSWQGGRSPLSTELAAAVQREVSANLSLPSSPEMNFLRPLLEIQQTHSILPQPGDLLLEFISLKGMDYLFVFPFAGRLVNEGLGTLAAYRWSRQKPSSLQVTANDYGFCLQMETGGPCGLAECGFIWDEQNLMDDLRACTNATEMAKRQFREIARVSGLIQPTFPGQVRPNRQLQISSSLLFDVFRKYDPSNRLLHQAEKEVLERQLEYTRLQAALKKMAQAGKHWKTPPRLTPFAFPLYADQLASRLSTEKWEDRIRRLSASLQ